MSASTLRSPDPRMAHKVRIFNRHWHLPKSKPIRIGLGILLIALGLLGFLPVLGFWMIPLGLLVLSIRHSHRPPLASSTRRVVASRQEGR
jgi:hypothetical protein